MCGRGHAGRNWSGAGGQAEPERQGGAVVREGGRPLHRPCGLAYACVRPTAASDQDIRKAQALCGRQGGLFASVGNVVYACVLPGTELPVDGLPIPGTDDHGGLRIFPILLGGGVLIGPGPGGILG